MADWLGIVLLYAVGSALLIIELFLPAHGMFGLAGIGVLGYGLYETFILSQAAGLVGLILLAIMLPTGIVLAVRNWHRLPVGRRMLPPNPKLTSKDRMPIDDLKPLIGRTGRALTLLRPVGTCEFDGRRVECKAEHGMILKDVEVEAVGLVDRTVSVRQVSPSADDAPNV